MNLGSLAAGRLLLAAYLTVASVGAQAQDSNQEASSASPASPGNDGELQQDQSSDASAAASSPALYQTIPVPESPQPFPTPSPNTRDTVQLEEIVVTATKRAVNVRELPASITHLSGEDLERSGANSIEDIVRNVPGVQFAYDDLNGSRVTTRGIAADGPTSATTGVFFDDLSFSDAYVPFVFLNPHPFDLEGVEVLKGPQGTLFGASALNGVVRYVPQKPVMGEWDTRYFAQGSAVSEGQRGFDYGGAVNAPIGDSLAVRVVGVRRNIPGFVDNIHPRVRQEDSNSGTQTSARALIAWQPDADWDVGLTYGWQRLLIYDTSATDNEDGRLSSVSRPLLQPNHTEYQIANLKVAYAFGSLGQLISDTGYVLKDGLRAIDASATILARPPTTIQSGSFGGHSTTLSEELRWVSADTDSPWSYIGGLFGWRQQIENFSPIVLGDPSLLPLQNVIPVIPLPITGPLLDSNGNVVYATQDFDVTVTELAAFGELSRKLGDHWSLTLGGRFYRTTSGGTSEIGGLAAVAGLLSRPPVIDKTIKEQGFNPKASLAFEPNNHLMSYATVSRGFRVGGVQPGVAVIQNPLAPIPQVFESDTIWSYEAGVRTTWLDDTLRLDASAYYLDWKDPQLAQPSSAGEGSIYLTNAGGVTGRGVELSAQYVAPFGLMLTAVGSLSRTVTSEPFRAANGEDIPVGTRWLLAPDKQTSVKLSWPLYLDSWILSPAVSHAYIGPAKYSFLFEGNVYGYQQWDAEFGIRNIAIPWLPEIALIGTNLADIRAETGIVRSGIPTGGQFVNYNQPRTVMLRLSGHF